MIELVCTKTKEHYNSDEPIWRSRAGKLLNIEFKPQFDLKKITSRKPNLWRYREAIPLRKNRNSINTIEGSFKL